MKFFILFLVITLNLLWGECSLSLSNEDINPAPMEYTAEGNISVSVLNLSPRQIPALTEGIPTCKFNIELSLLNLMNNDIGVIISTSQLSTYFTISYIAIDKRIEFVQKADIPANWDSQLTIPINVIAQSSSADSLNGFRAYIVNTEDEVSIYTYTNTAVLMAHNDLYNSVSSTSESIAINNITSNDTINGEVVILGIDVNISTITNATPLVVNLTTGSVTVPGGTPVGIYTETYTLCEIFNPVNCENASITVTVETSPDYTPKIRLTGAATSGSDTFVPVVLTITEIAAGENNNDIIIRLPKHDYISFVYDSSMTSLVGKALNNSDWEPIAHPAEYRFKYIGNTGNFAVSSFSRIGLQIRIRPQAGTSGKIDFQVDIKPGNGDDNAVNDSDISQIDYTN